MIKSSKTLAVIIPAHNESGGIRACLDSLIAQTVLPDEIIVLCNACTDNTSEIASEYDSVTVINLKQKGLINARNYGFDLAKSTILARINADVICDINWCEKLKENFNKPEVLAVAGVAKTKTLFFWPYLYTAFWSKIYISFSESYFGVPILWGANMALTKDAWLSIKNETCTDDKSVHEDQDLSIHLSSLKGKVVYDASCVVKTSETSYFNWPKFHQYNRLRKNTKSTHKEFLASKSINKIPTIYRISRYAIAFMPSLLFLIGSYIFNFIPRLLRNLIGRHR